MFTTYEREKLLISMAAIVAKDRKARGLKLKRIAIGVKDTRSLKKKITFK